MEEVNQTYETHRYEADKDDFNSLVLRLDPSPTLETIRRFLYMQTVKDENGKYYRLDGVHPIMDERGIEELMAEFYAIMSVDKVLSNLSENDIRLTVREVGEVVIEFVFSNYQKYNIKECDFNKIFYMVKHNIDIFLRRAKDGKENEMITKAFVSRETVHKQTRMNPNSSQQERGSY